MNNHNVGTLDGFYIHILQQHWRIRYKKPRIVTIDDCSNALDCFSIGQLNSFGVFFGTIIIINLVGGSRAFNTIISPKCGHLLLLLWPIKLIRQMSALIYTEFFEFLLLGEFLSKFFMNIFWNSQRASLRNMIIFHPQFVDTSSWTNFIW